MKLPKKTQALYGLQSLFAFAFFIAGIVTHDWFWLLACFVMSGNLYRVVNYQGDEE